MITKCKGLSFAFFFRTKSRVCYSLARTELLQSDLIPAAVSSNSFFHHYWIRWHIKRNSRTTCCNSFICQVRMQTLIVSLSNLTWIYKYKLQKYPTSFSVQSKNKLKLQHAFPGFQRTQLQVQLFWTAFYFFPTWTTCNVWPRLFIAKQLGKPSARWGQFQGIVEPRTWTPQYRRSRVVGLLNNRWYSKSGGIDNDSHLSQRWQAWPWFII